MPRKRSTKARTAVSSRSLSWTTSAASRASVRAVSNDHGVHSPGHLGEHLHEAPAGVPSKAAVAGAPGEAFHRGLGQPEVQDRVEHAGHRYRGARPHGEQQRVFGVAEALVVCALQLAYGIGDLVLEPSRQLAAVAHVFDAGSGGDGKAAWHLLGTQYPRHLGEICALVAEQLAHLGGAVFERVDPSRGCGGAAQILSQSSFKLGIEERLMIANRCSVGPTPSTASPAAPGPQAGSSNPTRCRTRRRP